MRGHVGHVSAVHSAERGFRVFAGRGTELEHEVPFAPLVEAFDDAVASLAGTDPAWLSDQLADLSGMFPALRGPAVLSARSAGERFRHHRAIRALLEQFPQARDIEISGAGLEEAFLELTAQDNVTEGDR